MIRVASIGECMIELHQRDATTLGLAYGGDTFNTAVYLARAGLPVAYATALGDDPYSRAIVALAEEEDIATDLIRIVPGRMPGLYLIETGRDGERTFHYWRDRSPARELVDTEADLIIEALDDAGLIYVSGITLSLYSQPGLARLADAMRSARAKGATIVMDGNYRPRGWQHDAVRARDILRRFWQICDVALPTFDDEQSLWDDADPAATAQRLAALGVGEIAIKLGRDGAVIATAGETHHVPILGKVSPIDTTGAGDSFNAAYLAARIKGQLPDAAALAGHRLAGAVIRHRGAIVPREATAEATRI
jgi:2-dehydro-3-deoxygluconokinase